MLKERRLATDNVDAQPTHDLATRHGIFGLIIFVALAGATLLGLFQSFQPSSLQESARLNDFSSVRAEHYLKVIAAKPHPIGTDEHQQVAAYIAAQVAGQGLTPEVERSIYVQRDRNGDFTAAAVQNIIARREGTGGSKAILLTAHYDSAISSFGAADDGAAVAALLETMRATRLDRACRNDVIYVFTDGEELNLLGAKVFAASHSLVKDVGVVLNFDARGSSGPSIMFETGESSGWLVDQFLHAAPHPVATSLAGELYRFMPNATDFSVFRAAGIPGLNFAFAEGWPDYHSALDTEANLDKRSLQHHGDYAIAMVRRLADSDLRSMPNTRLIYFNVVGGWVAAYPARLAKPLAALLAAWFIVIIIAAVRRGQAGISGTLLGFAVALLVPAVLYFVANKLWTAVFNGSAGELLAYYSDACLLALALFAMAASLSIYVWLFARLKVESLALGALASWVILAMLSAAYLPGASYICAWPLFTGLLAVSSWMLNRGSRRAAYLQLPILLISGVATALLIAPVVHLLSVAFPAAGYFAITLIAVSVGLVLPQIRLMTQARPWLVPSALALMGLVVCGILTFRTAFTARHPKTDQIMYLADYDQQTALWITADRRLDSWEREFFQRPRSEKLADRYVPGWYGPRWLHNAVLTVSEAVPGGLEPPTISVVTNVMEKDSRKLELLILSPRRAPEVALNIRANGPIIGAVLDGTTLDETVPMSNRRTAVANDRSPATASDLLMLRYYGLLRTGAHLKLNVNSAGPVVIDLVERSYDLPALGAPLPQRPAGMIPIRSTGDATIVTRRYRF